MGRRAKTSNDVFFIQRDRACFSRKVPYFLLGITVLLSMNILLILQQQPGEGLAVVQGDMMESRRLRQYVELSDAPLTHVTRQNEFLKIVRADNNAPVVAEIKATVKYQETEQARANSESNIKVIETNVYSNKASMSSTTKTSPPNLKITGKAPRNHLPPLVAGTYITPNEILLRTAVAIKTFNRAECLVQTVQSFRASYPDMPIFVADDSFEDTVSVNLTRDFDVTYIRLEIDSGVGYGRNRLVELIHYLGYQYLVMSDDDYTLEQHDLLLMMAEHLINTKADAVAPLRCDYGHCERSKGMIHMSKSGELSVFPNMSSYPEEAISACHRSDLMQQFFLTRTETIKKFGWDDVLKNNDHYDFLFNAKKNNLKLITCTDIKVLHNKKICQDKVKPELMNSYLQTRAERWLKLTGHVFRKWNLSVLFDETGKTIHLNGSGAPIIKPTERIVVNATHPHKSYFENAIIEHHNDRNPGWYSLRPKPNSRKTYVVYKQLNRCMYWLGGKMDVEYDRHASFPNKNQVITIDMHHLNKSCPIAEDFWVVNEFSKAGHRHVYFITAVSNDPVHMDRLMALVNNQTSREHTTFIIVDMGKDTEKYNISKQKTLIKTEYLYLGGPFSRSIGLKRGFDFGKQLALKRGHKDAIGFSIDTSIIIPANFTEVIQSHVRCGISSFAPVCYKHKEPGGYWVTTGYGMLGACFSDYDAIGGWDTRWGYRWGAEDVDIMNRMQKHIPFTVRTKEPNFEHLHSGSTRNTYKGYYNNKNLYDGELPVTPLTTVLDDISLVKRLATFVKEKTKTQSPMDVKVIYQTRNPDSDKTLYDVRLTGENGEEYFAVVESLL